MLNYTPTPTVEIHDKTLLQAGVKLLLKREDLNHPFVTGNKWWKLKYNLKEAIETRKEILLTFGGAYSNHIYATAAAANELKLKSIGIIRGEEVFPLNHTLSFAFAKGMEIRYISRQAYRTKDLKGDFKSLEQAYIIPEGGSNLLAVKGVSEFAKTLDDSYDYLCCPVGTGGTLAGLINGVDNSKKILGFPALKESNFLVDEIKKLGVTVTKNSNWQLIHGYHFGGYAKTTPFLLGFMESFRNSHSIPLEFVYTAKMMAGIFDLTAQGFFPRGATILAIHTGGLQGNNCRSQNPISINA